MKFYSSSRAILALLASFNFLSPGQAVYAEVSDGSNRPLIIDESSQYFEFFKSDKKSTGTDRPSGVEEVTIEITIETVNESHEPAYQEYKPTEAAHNFALDPFELGGQAYGNSLEFVLENFGIPNEIIVRREDAILYIDSEVVPVDYVYPDVTFTFGLVRYWNPQPRDNQPEFTPFTDLDVVQGFVVTGPGLMLRYGIRVGMTWDEVVRILGNPMYSNRYESEIVNHDTVSLDFSVDSAGVVRSITWPRPLRD